MAVHKDSEQDGVANYTINNGDLIALNNIKEKYDLRDSDDVITFAIGVLSQSGAKPISVEKEDGTIAKFLPADHMKRQIDGQDIIG